MLGLTLLLYFSIFAMIFVVMDLFSYFSVQLHVVVLKNSVHTIGVVTDFVKKILLLSYV